MTFIAVCENVELLTFYDVCCCHRGSVPFFACEVLMNNKDRERLKIGYRILAGVLAVIMVIGIIFGSFIN